MIIALVALTLALAAHLFTSQKAMAAFAGLRLAMAVVAALTMARRPYRDDDRERFDSLPKSVTMR